MRSPDIHIDVESARHLEVYDRIIERFGTDRVTVTGIPETYRARHALRDTGLHQFKRLAVCWERRVELHVPFIELACSIIWRRLKNAR